jgi:hypothetical protein
VVSTLEMVAITQHELIKLRREMEWYKSLCEAARKREEVLKKELEKVKGQLRDLKHLHYGKKTKQAARNQRPSRMRPRRSLPNDLVGNNMVARIMVAPIVRALSPSHELHGKVCAHCSLPYDPFPGDVESKILEIRVKTHIRKIILHRYHRKCSRPSVPNN